MELEEALNIAIDALDQVADETYEGDEREDPDCKSWLDARYEAIKVIQEYKNNE